MSFSLQMNAKGDLDLSSNVLGTVTGVAKLTQELSLWLRENYGVDRFHVNYGSVLDNYIGEIIDDVTQSQIEQEVLRILTVYQQMQLADVKNNPGVYTQDELLNVINSVEADIYYDSVNVTVVFTTASSVTALLTETVSL